MRTLKTIRSDIESVEISYHSLSGREIIAAEPLRFANTKVFKCVASFGLTPEDGHIDRIPLEFGSLDEIEFSDRELTERWIDILMQNTKLRKVTALNALQRDNLQLVQGAKRLKCFNLVEHFDWHFQ